MQAGNDGSSEGTFRFVRRYLSDIFTDTPDSLSAALPIVADTVTALAENDDNHQELCQLLYGFFKGNISLSRGAISLGLLESRAPDTGPSPTNAAANSPSNLAPSSQHWNRNLIDLRQPFGPNINTPVLRAWFNLMNVVIVKSVGSELRLKFRYLQLGPIAMLAFLIPQWHPEFCPRLLDVLDSWRIRICYDSESIECLIRSFRGTADAVRRAFAVADAQIAAHYIKLRDEIIAASKQLGSGAPEVDLRGTAATDEESGDARFPGHILEVVGRWTAAASDGDLGEPPAELIEWYKNNVGVELLGDIMKMWSEITEKYEVLLAKFNQLDAGEWEKARGQVVVLLKKELKCRLELLERQRTVALILESRHEYLCRKFEELDRILGELKGIEEAIAIR